MLFCAKLPIKEKQPTASIDIEEDADTFSQMGIERMNARFGHPTLYKPLMTPMVHAKAAATLDSILSSRSVSGVPGYEEGVSPGDIALRDLKEGIIETRSTDTSESNSRDGFGKSDFEVVDENQLDFAYFKERPEFKDYVGACGVMYGRSEDTMIDRSMAGTMASPAKYPNSSTSRLQHPSFLNSSLYGASPVPSPPSFINDTNLQHAAAAGFDITRALALSSQPQPRSPSSVCSGGYFAASSANKSSQQNLLDNLPQRISSFESSPYTDQRHNDYHITHRDSSDIDLTIQEPETLGGLEDAGISRNRQSYNYHHLQPLHANTFDHDHPISTASRSQSPMTDDGEGRASPLLFSSGSGNSTYSYGESQYR